ncbi:hypothetical protein WJX73_009245 [Symbiochloris irregularis]|uniref:PsbP C-terminal domain-containing protein n=1 Tax=Symbiochloris irregularis TaxID=706552 RepID=A0AAW1P5U1_9CHLO
MAANQLLSSNKRSLLGQTLQQRSGVRAAGVRCHAVTVRAQQEQELPRRAALGLVAGAAALLSGVSPSQAAFGEGANVFGKATNTTGFIPYAGEGYSLLLPSKWNPSRERDFKGVEMRYEDNGDAVNNVIVITRATDKKTVKDFGSAESFLNDLSYLFGQQVFTGQTRSEGGFKENKVSSASVLGLEEGTDKKGKPYYRYEMLVRTADGDEGGRHQLVTATVGSGNLYILKVQIGDKRWFKGAKNFAAGIVNSFTVA